METLLFDNRAYNYKDLKRLYRKSTSVTIYRKDSPKIEPYYYKNRDATVICAGFLWGEPVILWAIPRPIYRNREER